MRSGARRRNPCFFLMLLAAALPAAAGDQTWTSIGPDGGLIVDLAADPVHPGVLYAAGADSGVFLSRDGGASWAWSGHGLGVSRVSAIAVDPTAPSRVFAGTFSGVFRSVDSGQSWTNPAGPPVTVETLAVSSRDGSVYAGGFGSPSLWVSRDSGTTWTGIFPGQSGDPGQAEVQAVLLVARGGQESIYVASGFSFPGRPHLFRSRDGGATWTALTRGLPPLVNPSDQVQLASDGARGHLFASFQFTDHEGFPTTVATLRSSDGGTTWQPSGPGGFPLQVTSGGTVVAGAERSRDGGVTWTAAAAPPLGAPRFVADPFSPQVLYAGSVWEGAFRSTDAASSWQPRRSGMSGSIVQALATGPNQLWVASYRVGLQRASLPADDADDPSVSLQPAGSGIPEEAFTGGAYPVVAVDPLRPRVALLAWPSSFTSSAGAAGGGIARTANSGASWRVLNGTSWVDFLPYHLVIDPTSSQRVFLAGRFQAAGEANGCSIERSSDGGVTWSCIAPPDVAVETFALAPAGDTLYAMGADLTANPSTVALRRSDDHGASWTAVPVSGLEQRSFVSLLAFDPSNPSHLFISADDLLYASSDGGAHWQRLGQGLPPPATLFGIAVDPSDPARVYALTYQGLYVSRTAGRRFAPLNGGLPLTISGTVPWLALDPTDPRRIFVGLGGHGVYTYTRR